MYYVPHLKKTLDSLLGTRSNALVPPALIKLRVHKDVSEVTPLKVLNLLITELLTRYVYKGFQWILNSHLYFRHWT